MEPAQGLSAAMGGMAISKESLERAAATKEVLLQRMEDRKREMQERRARRAALNEQLADPSLSATDRQRLTDEFDAAERERLREARKRYSKDDFEQLVVIGRGAFGEVSTIPTTQTGCAVDGSATFANGVSLKAPLACICVPLQVKIVRSKEDGAILAMKVRLRSLCFSMISTWS